MDFLKDFFSHLYQLDDLIRWGGYSVLVFIVFAETGLLAGFFLPGDSLLVTAGLLAAVERNINIVTLNLLLSIAAIAGDTTGYWIGYHAGPRIFNRENSFFFHKDHLTRTKAFYAKYGSKAIILARFVPIVRTFIPTFAGVGKMEYKKFLVYNIAGGIGWVLVMTLLGYFLGRSIPHIEEQVHWIILAVIVISFLPLLREWLDARKQRRA